MNKSVDTQRLLLRPFQVTDAPEIYRLNASPEVMRFLGKREVYETVEEAAAFLSRYIEGMKTLPYARWAVVRKADAAWIGWCGLKLNENGETDLGFRLHEEYWGQGYATEAGKAWLTWARDVAGLKRVVAQTTSENRGSQRVITKLGFVREPGGDHDEGEFRWWNYSINLAGSGE